jgi:histidinol dehydrogenase
MKQYNKPERTQWKELIQRPSLESASLQKVVEAIFADIQDGGDAAVKKYTEKYDKISLSTLEVSDEEFQEAELKLSSQLKDAILIAKNNIEKFHRSQSEEMTIVETMPGVSCWRKSVAIDSVGLYVPGGTAPLFSTVLMLAVPAKIAGCKEIIICTPPDRFGKINAAILYAAKLVGVKKVFKVGGIQAIAAMTLGTESIPGVYKIFGPGNQYVTAAKQEAQNYGVALDLPAGPSELLIIADKSAIPEFVAADLLSQAEHGTDSQVILITDDEKLLRDTMPEIEKQLASLPRKETAAYALDFSRAILLHSMDECIEFSNMYAPEHLIIATEDAELLAQQITNAGSVFLGNYSCESIGDYASGTNHTLPTHGYARNYSGVSLDSFVKKITFQKITSVGIKHIGPSTQIMAEAEELHAHKHAVTVRLKTLNNQ